MISWSTEDKWSKRLRRIVVMVDRRERDSRHVGSKQTADHVTRVTEGTGDFEWWFEQNGSAVRG